MIELYKEKKYCCGCTACMNICPNAAISMNPDEEGFLYPRIDINKCNECGLCKKVCVFQRGYDISDNFKTPFAYAVKHTDENTRLSSSSGGAFTALSDSSIKKNGAVYGVTFDEEFNVVHQRAETSEERDTFKGSKYVQSDLRDIFKKVKIDLEKNKQVLFTGTPCQIAGLKSYLTKCNTNIESLILCDVLCFGVPSNMLWHDYVDFLEHKNKDSLVWFNFRYKWVGTNIRAVFNSGKVLDNTKELLVFTTIFYSCLAHRPSCHNCIFTNLERPSDLTIGDFWGIEKNDPGFADDAGVSLVLVNSPKGKALFDDIKQHLVVKESNVSNCLQPALEKPCEPSPNRNRFWCDYRKYGYEYIIKKYAGYGVVNSLKRCLRKMLHKIGVLTILKKILRRGDHV